jgi:alpha-1,3-rhamnosyl/mannosyltransferase
VYTRELIRRLPALAPDWHFHLLFADEALRTRELDACGLNGVDRVTSERIPYGIFAPEGQIRLPRHLQALRADLFHSPNYLIPYLAFPPPDTRRQACRCVTTIHDVIPLVVPDHAPQSRKSRLMPLFRLCLRQSIRRSDAVITVSQTSRRDMIRALSLREVDASRIQVVYNGVDPRFVLAATPPAPGTVPAILYVGRLDPYKHVVTLIRAFGQLVRQSGTPAHLLIVGPDDPRYPEARQVANDLGLADQITFLGFLRESELVAAYQEATVLVNPSGYEGFGLPLVEAMRCGVPVICCDGGAQREIVGEAARIVPVGDTQALTDALADVLDDAELRAHMIAGGLLRARQFDWDRTAAETLDIYRQALAGEGNGT